MKISDHPTRIVDEVIAEVHAVKRGISERHGNDIDRLLASLISQEQASGITTAERAGADQPATRHESKPEGNPNQQPDSKGGSR